MWRGFIGSCWLGRGCPVLRADTRENPVGKNGVMTHMNIRSGTTFDKSLRFTFGNVHEMPGWSTWLSEIFLYYYFVSLLTEIEWSHVCGIFRF
jgi:hypothetical protein